MSTASLPALRRLAARLAGVRKDLVMAGAPVGMAPGTVNVERRSATFILTTRAKDRDGEVVEPQGCLPYLDSYRKNPVVYFNHAYRNDDNAIPVGLATSPEGLFSLVVGPDQIVGTAYFHDLTPEARDIWELTKAGILKGASVGFIPKEFERIGPKAMHHLEWELFEFSVVPVPCNPEAVRVALGKGLESDAVHKALAPFAGRNHSWSKGAAIMPAAKSKRTKAAPVTGRKAAAPAKARTKAADDEDRRDEKPDETPKDKPESEDKPADDSTDDKPVIKQGADNLARLYGHHKGVGEALDTMAAANEHPDVVSYLQEAIEQNNAALERLQEVFGGAYPDHDLDEIHAGLGADDGDDEEDASVQKRHKPRTKAMDEADDDKPGESMTTDDVPFKMCKGCYVGMRKAFDGMAPGDEDEDKPKAEDKPAGEPEKKPEEDDAEMKALTADLAGLTQALGGN